MVCLHNAWQKIDARHKQEFLQAVDAKVSELEELLPLLLKDCHLAKGVSHLLSSQLTKILRTHAAVSGSAYRVTIPAVLHIACLRRMLNHTQA